MKNCMMMLGVLCLFLCGCETQPPLKRVIHLIAPPAETPGHWDPLVEEGAQRLAAADLAARYGLFAQYWAVDQAGGIPADAFPRVEIELQQREALRHLRLVRTGETFSFLGSDDGKRYILLGQWTSPIPAKAFAGAYVETVQKTGVAAAFTDVRLNGREFPEDSPHAQIGKTDQPGTIQREGNKWAMRTSGGKAAESPQCGLFLYEPVEGDFVMDAALAKLERKGNDGWAGPMCRAGLEADSPSVATWFTESNNGGALFDAGWRGHQFLENIGEHRAKVIFRSGPNQSKEVGEVTVASACWEDLCSSTTELSRIIREGIARELKLRLAHPAPAAAAKEAESGKLDLARKEALTLDSGILLRASGTINEVLDVAPTCPEAHYTAALCGALLACQDLFGTFHERERFLGGPLSHLLLAQELSPPQRAQDKLSCGWVMLACGYPDAALSALDSLVPDDRQQSEAKALEMFITRDYRPLTAQTVFDATPLERLAWLWAAQKTGRTDLLVEVPQRMAVTAGTPAFLPLYDTWFDVSAGHVQSALRPVLSLARDIADLAACEAIPAERRSAAADKLKADLGVEMEPDARSLEHSLVKRLGEGNSDETILPAIPIAMDLYEAAMALPAGPVQQGPPPRWQCLSVHDFAELQRGLTVLSLYDRIDFVGGMWGVNDLAGKLAERMSAGLAKFSDAADFLRATGLLYVSKRDQGKTIINSLLKKPFGQMPPVLYLISATWARWYPHKLEYIWLTRCRGSWELLQLADVAVNVGNDRFTLLLACMGIQVDHYSREMLHHLMWVHGRDLKWLDPYLARMPYDTRLLYSAASHSLNFGDAAAAEADYKRLIEMVPNAESSYSTLAYFYASHDQNAKAIEVAQEAVKNCPYSVGLSNLMGHAAMWLVKESRPEEALKMGRAAAESYSATGLEGLAVALAANGKKDEALQVYRAAAHRYENRCAALLQFLCDEKYHDDDIMAEIESCLKEFETTRDQVLDAIELKFEDLPAKYKLLERLYAGPLSSRPAATRDYNLARLAIYCRQFEDAFRYMQQLTREKERSGYELLFGCLAAKLAGKTDLLQAFLAAVPESVQKSDIAPYVECLAGRSSTAGLVEKCSTPYAKACADLLLGVEAETKGDLRSALDNYKAAAAVSTPYWAPVHLGKYWAAAVEEKLKAATPPAK
jgi:Tfp pilus assembly protein PilF